MRSAGAASPAGRKPRELLTLAALIIVGLGIRYAYAAHNFVITNDGVEYLQAARRIREEGPSALKSLVRQPLYPAVLWAAGNIADRVDGGFDWRPGQMAELARLTGIALYVPFLAASWAFFRAMCGARLAPWALAVLIVHPLFGFYFANALSETLYLTFVALGLAFFVSARGAVARGAGRAFVLGLGAGLAVAAAFATRTEGQIILIAGVTHFAWRWALSHRRGDRDGARGNAFVIAGAAAGMLVPALLLLAHVGASASRYSWEWLWRRVVEGVRLPGEEALGTTPARAVWMLAETLASHAPEVLCLGVAAVAWGAYSTVRTRKVAPPAGGYGIVLVTLAWYALAIIAGVSIQNGVVSQRYIQPLVLMAIPVLAAFVARFVEGRAYMKPATAVIAAIAVVCALGNAATKWGDYKTGHRDAGAAAGANSLTEHPKVLTSSPRVAFYAGASGPALDTREVLRKIVGGEVRDYDSAVLETKRYNAQELTAMTVALESAGFRTSATTQFPEDGADRLGRRMIIVFAMAEDPSEKL